MGVQLEFGPQLLSGLERAGVDLLARSAAICRYMGLAIRLSSRPDVPLITDVPPIMGMPVSRADYSASAGENTKGWGDLDSRMTGSSLAARLLDCTEYADGSTG